MRLLSKLIAQSKTPSGWLGRRMLRIMNHAHKSLAAWGLSYLRGGENFLEVGCGGGVALSMACKLGQYQTYYGVDLSPEAIALAAKRNHQEILAGSLRLIEGDVSLLPFTANCFDGILTVQSHYHWGDVVAGVKEVHRVLKPGGRFVLVSEVDKLTYHMAAYHTPQDTLNLLAHGRFEQTELHQSKKAICVIGTKQKEAADVCK